MEVAIKSKAVRKQDIEYHVMSALASLAMALVWGAVMNLTVPSWGLWSGVGIFAVCYVVLLRMGREPDWTFNDF